MSDIEALIERARETSDAMLWAEAFCAMQRELGHPIPDEGVMVGWFANAIESCRHNRMAATAAFKKFMASLDEVAAVETNAGKANT